MTSQATLFGRYIKDLPIGKLEWIGLRPARREPMQASAEVAALAGLGLEGDRRCKASPGSARQVTIISAEQINLVASYLKHDHIDPALLRRNLVVSGINLNALPAKQSSRLPHNATPAHEWIKRWAKAAAPQCLAMAGSAPGYWSAAK